MSTFDVEIEHQPEWITCNETLEEYDIESINQGGCASGAYMPAVTYNTAQWTMSKHGDEVLQYIEDCLGELTVPPEGTSWSGMAVYYLSMAVELWCSQFDN